MRHDIDINKIASMLTDDPDIFVENEIPKKCPKCKPGRTCPKCLTVEASKPKSSKKSKGHNAPDTEKFDDKFKTIKGHSEKRKKPETPGKEDRPASSLGKLKGQEGSKSSPYLKSSK